MPNNLHLFNTMTRELEEFTPLEDGGPVRMYNCGPTVYDFQHIGNLRAYVFVDILCRTLEANDHEVKQIINITDVGHLVSDGDTGKDKMTKGLKKEGLAVTLESMKSLGEKYATIFKKDLATLNITPPEKFPKASEHIEEDIAFVELLETNGFTYETADGLYFDTTKLDDYGKLAGGISADDDSQTRVENSEKKNPRDFAVWKFDAKLGWNSPWGQGFPGWHIECSVMAREYLDTPFDIHTGGIDHIPVHHTNEIAQTEAATGDEMANFWLHNNFMQIDTEKISKSIGNTLYLKDIIERGFDPLAYRYLLLGAHYRSEINFSWESLSSAATSLKKLRRVAQAGNQKNGTVIDAFYEKFMNRMNDDLNTAQALAIVWETADTDESTDDISVTLKSFDAVLGLDLFKKVRVDIPEDINELAKKRQKAREAGDFETADKLRDEIHAQGFAIRDNNEDGGFEIVRYDKKTNQVQ